MADLIWFSKTPTGGPTPVSMYVSSPHEWSWLQSAKNMYVLFVTDESMINVGMYNNYSISDDTNEYFTHSLSSVLTILHALPSSCCVHLHISLCNSSLLKMQDVGSQEERDTEIEKLVNRFPSYLGGAVRNLLSLYFIQSGYFTAEPYKQQTEYYGCTTPDVPRQFNHLVTTTKWLTCGCRVDGSRVDTSRQCSFQHTCVNEGEWTMSVKIGDIMYEWEETPKYIPTSYTSLLSILQDQTECYALLVRNVRWSVLSRVEVNEVNEEE